MVVRVDARVAACSIPPPRRPPRSPATVDGIREYRIVIEQLARPNRLVLGPDASLLDLAAFEQALEALLGRRVDVISERAHGDAGEIRYILLCQAQRPALSPAQRCSAQPGSIQRGDETRPPAVALAEFADGAVHEGERLIPGRCRGPLDGGTLACRRSVPACVRLHE